MNAEQHDIRLPVVEVARRLNCSRQHVYNLINSGELKAVRLGKRMGLRVAESDIFVFLNMKEDS
jgi:excisionase family DNA binding protein